MKVLNKLELMNPNVKIGGENGYIVELPSESGCVLTQAATETKIATAKTEAIDVAKQYTDSAVTSVYRVKGVVASVEDLPENAEIGDVYNIGDDLDGHNYVKTESGWDKLGGTVNLGPYALKVQVESDISTAKSEAIAAAASETQTQISALNISQYAKTDDVYTKTAADSTFVKIGEEASEVKAENIYACGITSEGLTVQCAYVGNDLSVSGDLTVFGKANFNYSVEFNCIPTIRGACVATFDDLEFLPATANVVGCSCSCVDSYTVSDDVNFTGDLTVCSDARIYDTAYIGSDGIQQGIRNYSADNGLEIFSSCSIYITNSDNGGSGSTHFKGSVDFNDKVSLSEISSLDGCSCILLGSNCVTVKCGKVVLCEDLTVCGKSTFCGYSVFCGGADFYGTVAVEGSKVATLDDLEFLPATDSGACYTVSDDVNFNGAVNFDGAVAISEGLVIGDDLTVCGCTHIDSLDVTGGAQFNTVPTVGGIALATKSDVENCTCINLSIAKDYTDEEIGKLGSVLEYKGNSTYEDLPTENETGDVYNITADYDDKEIKAGDNVVWNGSDWDVLSGPVDLSGYYDKTEVDEKLGGYLPATKQEEGYYGVNETVFFNACGNRFLSDAYFDALIYLKDRETSKLSFAATETYVDREIAKFSECTYTKNEVNTALEGYLPVTLSSNNRAYVVSPTPETSTSCLMVTGLEVYSLSVRSDLYVYSSTYLYGDIEDKYSIVNKKYVDDTVSTANSNIVYDEDIELGDGTFDETNKEMTWTITPTGATKIISLLAVDASGNVVFPSYIWKDKVLTVKIYAESELDNPGYTVTVSYKK